MSILWVFFPFAFFHFKTSPPSTSVVKKNAAKLFCCEAPQCVVT